MPRRLRKEKDDPKLENEQENGENEEEEQAMDYGVSEENHGGEQEEQENEGEGQDDDKEAEETFVAALEPDVVKEGKYSEIADFFLDCKQRSTHDAKSVLRKVLEIIYDKEDEERRAKKAEKRKREQEEAEARGEDPEKKAKSDQNLEDFPTFDSLPLESFLVDDDEVNDAKLNLVVLIPNGAVLVGHIIGRGGTTVKEAKNRSGADIRVESDKFLAPGTPDRRIALRGTVKTIAFAAQYLLQLVKDKIQGSSDEPVEKDILKFVVPDQSAGRLIGQKWVHMKEMETITKTRLQVLGKTQLPAMVTGRVIQAEGSFEGVCHAFYLCAKTVVEKLDYPDVWQTGDPTKDPSGRRDPPKGTRREDIVPPGRMMDRRDDRDLRNELRNPARPYGLERERPRFTDLPPSRFSGPPQPPFGGPAVDPLITASRLGPYGPAGGVDPARGAGYGGAGRSYNSEFGSPSTYGASPSAVKETQTKTEIEIPEQSVGFVFGRKGCQIRDIRQRSGASIDSDKRDDSADHRILTVAGSLSAVKMAVDMVNDLVLEWGRRERDNPRGF